MDDNLFSVASTEDGFAANPENNPVSVKTLYAAQVSNTSTNESSNAQALLTGLSKDSSVS